MDKQEIKEEIVRKLFELYHPSNEQEWFSLVTFTMEIPMRHWNDIAEALDELVSAHIVRKLPVHIEGAGVVYYWYQINTATETENGHN